MNRIATLAAALFLTAGAAASADARQVWYGPGSGANPFAKTTAQPAVARGSFSNSVPQTQNVGRPQPCVAGSQCFNGYVGGHLPNPYQQKQYPLPTNAAPKPQACVAGSQCFNGYVGGHLPNPYQR